MRKTGALALLLLVCGGSIRANEAYTLNLDSNFSAKQKKPLGDTSFVYSQLQNPVLSYQNLIFKRRLDSLQKTVQLDYNEHVQEYIDILCTKGKEKISRSLGLSKYYFPIYERIFAEENIPDEVKYLSIVESALNPHAVSHVGATGLWQFMHTTGKVYGLTIDDWEDQRKDPVAASYAAAAYLQDSYNQFGDWLLALASYNCGRGNIERAIAKAGGVYDFWAIRSYLPIETRNYIPAYIATVYAMNYHKRHNISPGVADFPVQTEVVQINSKVSLEDVAKVANVNLYQLSTLNPSYKKKIINATPDSPRSLVLPVLKKTSYGDLYNVLNNGQPPVVVANFKNKPVPGHRPLYYKVRDGDNLSVIANKFEIEVQDLLVWNAIKPNNTTIMPGQTLRVSGSEKTLLKISEYFNYRVQPGDTLLKIAQKFEGATVTGIKVLNNLVERDLVPGMILRIVKG